MTLITSVESTMDNAQNTGATALLLNWKRSDNLHQVIESIKCQSVQTEILLWNNNIHDQNNYEVDLQINSSVNLMCYPRWFLINYSKYNYVFTLDDDIKFKDSMVIENCIEYLNDKNCAIGRNGVILNQNKDYWNSTHIAPHPSKDIKVDIIKGRFIIANKKTFENVYLLEDTNTNISNPKIEDDIYVSAHITNKIIPAFLSNRFTELNDLGVGCFGTSHHKKMRKLTTYKYFL